MSATKLVYDANADALRASPPKDHVAIEAQNPPPDEDPYFPEPLSFNELAFAVLGIYRDFDHNPPSVTEERLRLLCLRIDRSMEP